MDIYIKTYCRILLNCIQFVVYVLRALKFIKVDVILSYLQYHYTVVSGIYDIARDQQIHVVYAELRICRIGIRDIRQIPKGNLAYTTYYNKKISKRNGNIKQVINIMQYPND